MTYMRPITEAEIATGLDALLGESKQPLIVIPTPKLDAPERVVDDGRDWLRVASCGQQEPSMASILRAVSLVTKVSTLEMKSPRRSKNIARARQIYFYLARKLTSRSFPQIARYVGRDHSTVIHAIKQVETYQQHFEPELSQLLAAFNGEQGAA